MGTEGDISIPVWNQRHDNKYKQLESHEIYYRVKVQETEYENNA